jgi:hypothetical protein
MSIKQGKNRKHSAKNSMPARKRDSVNVVINFSHPLTEVQVAAIERIAGAKVGRVIEVKSDFDDCQTFTLQTTALVDSVGLSAREWQTLRILIHLPSLSVIAALLLAELHGRMGFFPAVLRLRPISKISPPEFEVAEILDLYLVRENARQHRWRSKAER